MARAAFDVGLPAGASSKRTPAQVAGRPRCCQRRRPPSTPARVVPVSAAASLHSVLFKQARNVVAGILPVFSSLVFERRHVTVSAHVRATEPCLRVLGVLDHVTKVFLHLVKRLFFSKRSQIFLQKLVFFLGYLTQRAAGRRHHAHVLQNTEPDLRTQRGECSFGIRTRTARQNRDRAGKTCDTVKTRGVQEFSGRVRQPVKLRSGRTHDLADTTSLLGGGRLALGFRLRCRLCGLDRCLRTHGLRLGASLGTSHVEGTFGFGGAGERSNALRCGHGLLRLTTRLISRLCRRLTKPRVYLVRGFAGLYATVRLRTEGAHAGSLCRRRRRDTARSRSPPRPN